MSDANLPRSAPRTFRSAIVSQAVEHALDAAQIIAFATQFDPQPFHTDPEKAEHTFFRGLAASGWHTAALTMKLLVESGIPLADGIIGSGGVAWPQPTRPDDVLHVESEVMEIIPSRSKLERGMVVMRCETRNQRGEVLQRFAEAGGIAPAEGLEVPQAGCCSASSSASLNPAFARASRLKGGFSRGASWRRYSTR